MSEEDEAADCKENGQKAKPKVCQVLIIIITILFQVWSLNEQKTDPLSRLLLEIKDQTCQAALRHRHLLQECPF